MVSYQIIWCEVRRFLVEPRSLLVIPAILGSALVALWPHTSHWITPVLVGTFVILEPTFNNILFRSPHEFELLAVTPVRWQTVVFSKNCAAIMLAVGTALFLGIPTVYALPDPPTTTQLISGGELLLSVLFTMLMAGNLRSIQTPRRHTRVGLTDMAEAVITLVILGIALLPYWLLTSVVGNPGIVPVYILFTAALWMTISIRSSATSIERERTRLCQTE